MRQRTPRRISRSLIFISSASLFGALTVGITTFTAATPAYATCSTVHTNAEGYDKAFHRYGNSAEIYVNTSATIGSSQDAIFRSLFVTGGFWNNDVEVGWLANWNGHSGPTVYAEWVNRSVDSDPQLDTSDSLSYNTDYRFWVFNVGHMGVFRFKFNLASSPFNYSPSMNFDLATILTNSEHHNSCDSMWTHMYGLEYFDSGGSWNSGYGDLECFYNNSINAWLFNKISNTELKVDQNVGISGSSCDYT
jgi:hypothetical protein